MTDLHFPTAKLFSDTTQALCPPACVLQVFTSQDRAQPLMRVQDTQKFQTQEYTTFTVFHVCQLSVQEAQHVLETSIRIKATQESRHVLVRKKSKTKVTEMFPIDHTVLA